MFTSKRDKKYSISKPIASTKKWSINSIKRNKKTYGAEEELVLALGLRLSHIIVKDADVEKQVVSIGLPLLC
jgi:hypothetical protein